MPFAFVAAAVAASALAARQRIEGPPDYIDGEYEVIDADAPRLTVDSGYGDEIPSPEGFNTIPDEGEADGQERIE